MTDFGHPWVLLSRYSAHDHDTHAPFSRDTDGPSLGSYDVNGVHLTLIYNIHIHIHGCECRMAGLTDATPTFLVSYQHFGLS